MRDEHSGFGGIRGVSRETAQRLIEFESLVRQWNVTVQLVSRRDAAELEERHTANSLALLPLLQRLRPRSILDIGSGGGFPGLVLAIATGLPVQLVEADRRKAAFLQEASRRLRVQVHVIPRRIETVVAAADTVTSRAFAPLQRLWPIAERLLAPGGRGLFLYGPGVAQQAVSARCSGLVWSFERATIYEVAAA